MLRHVISLYRDAFGGLARETWVLVAVALVNRAGTMVLPFLTLYLTRELRFDKSEAGWVIFAFGLGSVIGTFAGGRLSDRVGAIPVQLFSLIAGGAGFLLLGLLRTVPALMAGFAALGMQTGQVIVRVYIMPLPGQGPLEQGNGLRVAAPAHVKDTEVVHGLHVRRIDVQYPSVQVLRLSGFAPLLGGQGLPVESARVGRGDASFRFFRSRERGGTGDRGAFRNGCRRGQGRLLRRARGWPLLHIRRAVREQGKGNPERQCGQCRGRRHGKRQRPSPRRPRRPAGCGWNDPSAGTVTSVFFLLGFFQCIVDITHFVN